MNKFLRASLYRGGRPPLVWDASNVSKSRWWCAALAVRDALKIGAVSERVGAKRRLLPGRKAALIARCSRWNVAPATHLITFRAGLRRVPEFSLGGEDIWGCSRPRGTEMGENLVLLSCSAAFITGIVIAGASLFGG